MPALRLDAALVHLNRADAAGNGQYLGPDPYFDDLFCLAAGRAYLSCERIVPTASCWSPGRRRACWSTGPWWHGVVETPGGAHFTSCVPDYGRDEAFQARYAAAAADAELAALPGRVPGRRRGQLPAGGPAARVDGSPMTGEPSPAEVCVVACAEAWRGDGAILASPMGLIPPWARGWRSSPSRPACCSPTARPISWHRMARTATAASEGWLPYRAVFTMVAAGLRHVMMGAAQIDRFGNQNISCIGDWARPKAQLLGVRGAPGNTINHPVSYWVPRHSRRVFVERVDMVCGIGYDRAAGLGPRAARFHELRVVVTNLAVLDFQTADHTMRLRSVHPGVTAADVTAATGFPLAVPDEVPVTRLAHGR